LKVGGNLRQISEENVFRPRPIKTSAITFSPTGDVTSVDHTSLAGQSGGRVSIVSQTEGRISEQELSSCKSPNHVMVAVVNTATHAFNKEDTEKFYNTSVRTSTNMYDCSSTNTGISNVDKSDPMFSLVASSPQPLPIWPTDQPAGFKRTAQFSSKFSKL